MTDLPRFSIVQTKEGYLGTVDAKMESDAEQHLVRLNQRHFHPEEWALISPKGGPCVFKIYDDSDLTLMTLKEIPVVNPNKTTLKLEPVPPSAPPKAKSDPAVSRTKVVEKSAPKPKPTPEPTATVEEIRLGMIWASRRSPSRYQVVEVYPDTGEVKLKEVGTTYTRKVEATTLRKMYNYEPPTGD